MKSSPTSTDRLRIAIAEDDPDHRDLLLRALSRAGHDVTGAAETGQALIDMCRTDRPDLVITDIRMPDMDGLDAAEEIYKHDPVPVIAVTSFHDPEFIARAKQRHVLAFLVKPITEPNLEAAIVMVLRSFEEFSMLKKENASLAQALEDRKVIERAKGLLMKQAGLDEPDAFKRLQKLARDQRKKLADVAQMVVAAADLLRPQ